MTGTEIKDFVKHMLFEDASTTALATDVQLTNTINIANQSMWLEAAKAAPKIYGRHAEFNYPAGGMDFTTIDSTGVYHLASVHLERYPDTFTPLSRILQQDAHRFDGHPYPRAFYEEGERLYLAPDVDARIRVSWVQTLPYLSSTTQALGGKLSLFHPIVAYHACVMLCAKDEARASDYKALRDEMKGQMLRHLTRNRSIRVL